MNRTPPHLAFTALAPIALLAALTSCSNSDPPAHSPKNVNVSVNDPPAHSAPAPSLLETASVPAPSASPSAPPPSSSPHRYVIAAIGDSLTDFRSQGGRYLTFLKSRCPGIEIDNFAKGGTMVNQMRRSFDTQVAASPKHYTHLVVFGGVNDLYSDLTAFRTPAKIEGDLGYMYAWGKAHGVEVVAFTVAPWGGFKRYFNPSRAEATRTVNAWIRERPAHGEVDHVVDAYALLSCTDPELLCDRFFEPFKDGLHFGPPAHQILGQALYESVFADCE